MAGLTALFKKPKVAKPRRPDAPAPPPERNDAETTALADEQRKRALRGGGRASTLYSKTGESGAVALLGTSART